MRRSSIYLFWHKGYNATSMQDLVDALGISHSSLYNTYSDKHTLFLKALESYQLAGNAKINKVVDQTNSAKEKVIKLMELPISDLVGDKQQKGGRLGEEGMFAKEMNAIRAIGYE